MKIIFISIIFFATMFSCVDKNSIKSSDYETSPSSRINNSQSNSEQTLKDLNE